MVIDKKDALQIFVESLRNRCFTRSDTATASSCVMCPVVFALMGLQQDGSPKAAKGPAATFSPFYTRV